MGDKSPKRANDKKQGKSLTEKRAAKRQKRAQRQDDAAVPHAARRTLSARLAPRPKGSAARSSGRASRPSGTLDG